MSDILLRFAHVSDTHIRGELPSLPMEEKYSEEMRTFIDEMFTRLPFPQASHTGNEASKKLVQQINNLPFELDFVLHTGDIGSDPREPSDYEPARAILSKLRYPIYYVPGNHDDPVGVQQVLMGHTDVKTPMDYTFTHNGVQIVCVDSRKAGEITGEVTAEQLAWLEATVLGDSDLPLVVAVHHQPYRVGSKYNDRFWMENGDAFHDIMKRIGHRLRGVFIGHKHVELDAYREGVLYSCVASPFMQFNTWPGVEEAAWVGLDPAVGFSVVTVTSEQTFVRRFHYALHA